MVIPDQRRVPVSGFVHCQDNCFRAAEEDYWKNFLESVSNFVEGAIKKFIIKYHNTKLFRIFENHQRIYKKELN
jgi:hypothetical protein